MCGTNRRWREDGAAAFVRERSRQCPPGRVRSRQFTKVQLRAEVRTCKALSDLVMCLTGDGSLYRLPSGYGADEPRLVP
jgi:hypothetical protein